MNKEEQRVAFHNLVSEIRDQELKLKELNREMMIMCGELIN